MLSIFVVIVFVEMDEFFADQFFCCEYPQPVKMLREIPPTRSVCPVVAPIKERDDLLDLVISESNREDFIEHSNIFLEYEAEFNVQKYCTWIRELSRRRGLALKDITVLSTRGKTCALISWDRQMRSKCRQIMDYKGQHPTLRRAYKLDYRRRIHRYIQRMRSSGVSK